MTACGFCVVAALSSQTRRLPLHALVQDREIAAEDMRVELPCSRKRWQRELWNVLRR